MCTKNQNHMMFGSWDAEWDRQNFLSFWAIFCPFTTPAPLYPPPPNDPKNQNFEKKWKRCLEILSFYTYMCTINEDYMIYNSWNIRCHRQVILCHFLPFQPSGNSENLNFKIEKNTWTYYHFTYLHHKWQSFDVWFLGHGARQTELFIILERFLLFYPPMDPENQNLKKMKKVTENIIILQMCTVNDSHMMHGSWDVE